MRLGTRITLVAMVPLLGLTALCVWVLSEQYVLWQRADMVMRSVTYAPSFGGLAHEMQKERGLSAGYITAKGGNFTPLLEEQRRLTDAAYAKLVAMLNNGPLEGAIGEAADAAMAEMGALADMRRQVSDLTWTVPDMAKAYTGRIMALITTASMVADTADDVRTARIAGVYNALLMAKEMAGRERAAGAVGFAAGRFSHRQLHTLATLGAEQDALVALALSRAPAKDRPAIEAITTGEEAARADALREVALESLTSGNVGGITGPEWFAASTARIDVMKKAVDAVTSSLLTVAGTHVGEARTHFFIIVIAGGLNTVLCLLVSIFNVRGLKAPISRIVTQIGQVSSGTTDISIEDADRSDEIGDIASALELMRRGEVERRKLLEKEAERHRLEELRTKRMEEAIDAFQSRAQTTLAALDEMSHALTEVADNLADTADHTASGSTQAKASSDEAARAVQGVAAAIDQLHGSIHEITSKVATSQKATDAAASVVTATSKRVTGLATAAEAINNVATMIASIAEQTNLLALNATIEAERAGPAGRGFAVVAHEVKALANQTAAATSEIAKQIEDIQSETRSAVQGIDEILGRFDALRSSSQGISSVMSEQSAATRDIGAGVQSATEGSLTASKSVSLVVTAAEKASHDAHDVQSTATRMRDVSSQLREVFSTFLTQVRAV